MTEGVCFNCKITDEQVDGDRIRWHNTRRTCCSKYDCVKKYKAQIKEAHGRFLAGTRKKSPAEIYELQQQERRARNARNARYRADAKARGLLRGKGDAA